MTNTNRQALQAYLDRPLDDLVAELERADPRSDPHVQVWTKMVSPLYKRLCVEWNFCDLRQKKFWQSNLDMGVEILEVLARPGLNLPFEVDLHLVTAILIKRGLDRFCGCLEKFLVRADYPRGFN
jgi:hypothetical protein